MNELQKERIAILRRQGESYTKIADALGISVNTIQSYCRRNKIGVELPAVTETDSRFCKQCGVELIQQSGRKTRRFCTDKCCADWWKAHPEQLGKKAVYGFTCVYCNTDFTAYGDMWRKYCSQACYITDRFGKAVAE